MSDSFEYEPELTPAQQTLLVKQQEHAGLTALKEASDQLVERIEKLAGMSNIMADGGETIGQVMRNWPHVFSILSLQNQQPTAPDPTTGEEAQADLPKLVRLPYTGEDEPVEKAS